MKERKISSSLIVQENQRIMRKEVKYNMKDRQCIRQWSGYWLITILGILITLLITPLPALAVDCTAPDPAADADMDGFTDLEECVGLSLFDGTAVPGALDPVPRQDRLDPESKDLFVIWVPATPTNVPVFPTEFVNAPFADGGLALVTHIITPDQAPSDRLIGETQKAIRITENLDVSNSDTLAIANYGTPNDLDFATIYTQRIIEHVNSVCALATDDLDCKDIDGVTIGSAALIEKYTKHTIAHEMGHLMSLTSEYNSRFGGYHYKTGTNVELDQSVKYVAKRGNVTFYIGSAFTNADQADMRLK
jgi:hypothetical protein